MKHLEGNIFIKEDSATSAPLSPAQTSTYQGCDCETCKELNVDCPLCPVCKEEESEEDSEVAMAMYDSQMGKADPCWEGYVMRGMKPGADGKPVPNCIPVNKSDSWTDSPFRISK